MNIKQQEIYLFGTYTFQGIKIQDKKLKDYNDKIIMVT